MENENIKVIFPHICENCKTETFIEVSVPVPDVVVLSKNEYETKIGQAASEGAQIVKDEIKNDNAEEDTTE